MAYFFVRSIAALASLFFLLMEGMALL